MMQTQTHGPARKAAVSGFSVLRHVTIIMGTTKPAACHKAAGPQAAVIWGNRANDGALSCPGRRLPRLPPMVPCQSFGILRILLVGFLQHHLAAFEQCQFA